MAANKTRLGRLALVVLVLVMASSYVRPAVDWFEAHRSAGQQQQRLQTLQATQKRLQTEKARLTTQRGLTVEARRLGMVREGERTYVVRGLPKD